MPDGAGVTFDVGVLPGLSGLEVQDRDPQFVSPDQRLATDVFRAVVDPYGAVFAVPIDDPVNV